jgi:gamma-glutamyltranspeptidase/glutathione hydrolase
MVPEARGQADTPAPVALRRAAATESSQATDAALEVLRVGGTAADAAIAAAFVAGVTAPSSSGLGGGGFVLAWDAARQSPFVLDFRETAPLGIDAEAFERRPFPDAERGRLVGTYGEAKGLFELHRRSGKLRWADLVARAERQAQRGFVVGAHLAGSLAYGAGSLATQPSFAALYYPGGKPAPVGTRIVNPLLAKTLARLAAEGPQALYQGSIAEELALLARNHSGALSPEDLERYRVIERTPLRTRWEGYDVFTMPPPSAGGLMLSQLLRLFSADELRRLGHNTPAYQHLLAEGMRGAIADRMRFLGDPDHVAVDVEALLDARRLAERRRTMALDRTHTLPRFGLEEHGTHHLVTSDSSGNVVALTTTVNRGFGAKLMGPDSGVVLNDELNDFTEAEDVRPFGLTVSPNRPRPGARPVSSMTPTIVVRQSRPVLALGGSGGPTIATNVTQVALGALVFGLSPERAVSAPRVYIPSSGPTILVEEGTPADHIADLEWRGEIVGTMKFKTTAVQMLRFDAGTAAAADPRKHGTGRVD